MRCGALTTVNEVPAILVLEVLYCKKKCTSIYLLLTLLHVFFATTQLQALCTALVSKKRVCVLVFCKYTFHNKHQEHLQQWSCQPWHGGTCSPSFRQMRVIVTEKESIARSVKGCSGDLFFVPSLPWMREPFSHQQIFILFHSYPSWSSSRLP